MKVMVTGGAGFLGKGICEALLKKGMQVRSFSRGDYPELREMGIETSEGDLADEKAVQRAVEGCDAVMHVAGKPGIFGPYEDYYKVNTLGTQFVIDACKKYGVKKLVYTSTPSVVFRGVDQEGVDESDPYPEKFLINYQKTKALAEQAVLKANSPELATVALRPHLLWGPGDNQLVPRLIAKRKMDTLRLVGDGRNIVDSLFIENGIYAHVLALEKLGPGSPIAGKVYFISNDCPGPMGELQNSILKAGGIPEVTKTIPVWVAYTIGALLEFAYTIMGKKEEPQMTRFLALSLSQSHWFNISAAKRDLGYEPPVSMEEGLKKIGHWLKNEGKDAYKKYMVKEEKK